MRLAALLLLLSVAMVQAANVAPTIWGSTNQVARLPGVAGMAALVQDDGLPSGVVTQLWSKISGPGTVTFTTPTNTLTDATFSEAGDYVLRLLASDGDLSTTQDTTVYVQAEPYRLRLLFSGTGSGNVTISGDESAYVWSNYIKSYTNSTSLNFAAAPAEGSTFVGWVGDYTGTNTTCSLTVSGSKEISAIFDTTGTGTSVYYVATNGSDSNPGSEAQPWLTIGKATTSVAAGAKVKIGPGVYNYPITNTVQGTAASPILYEGTRGAAGEWLTIIDPSTDFSSGWVAAPEIGAGVYKLTDTPFAIRELTISNLHVAPIYTMGTLPYSSYAYENPLVATGAEYLALASDAILHVTLADGAGGLSEPIRFWDSWGALWATTNVTASSYITYLRLRDGSDPNGLPIRGHPNVNTAHQQHTDYVGAAVKLRNDSYTVWRNLHFRNAFGGFLLDTGSHDNTIENCYFTAGVEKVIIRGACYRNTVRNNHATTAFYGWRDMGAHNRADETWEYRFLVRQPTYVFSKYGSSTESSSFDNTVYLFLTGSSNVVSGNHFWGSLGSSISVSGPDPNTPITGTRIFDNITEKNSSVGLTIVDGTTDTRMYNNDVWDNNIAIRLHSFDSVSVNTTNYVYRNRIWNPNNTGSGMFIHIDDDAPIVNSMDAWIYHNSFSGGLDFLDVSDWIWDNGGVPKLTLLNNVYSMAQYLTANENMGFRTNANMLRAYDYNVIAWPTALNPSGIPVWFGANNIVTNAIPWSTNSLPTFLLTADSAAIDHALDLAHPFTLNGTNYAALPTTMVTQRGSAWDIGETEYVPPDPAASATQINAVHATVGTIRYR